MRKEIQDLLAKKDFSEGLLKLDDVSKVKDYFTTKGNLKDVTDEEIKELGSNLEILMQKISELPEDKLEKIGGGGPGIDLVHPDGEGKKNIWDVPNNENLTIPELGEEDWDATFKGKNGMSTGAKAGIGIAAAGGLAAAGAGLYKLGKKKGWWKGFSRKK